MSKCVDHKTTFLDTHRHFSPATEISRKFPIVCKGLKLKTSYLKHEKCLDAQPMNDMFEVFVFLNINFRTSFVKKQELSNAQFRIETASELCIREPLIFHTWGTQISIFSFSHLSTNQGKQV